MSSKPDLPIPLETKPNFEYPSTIAPTSIDDTIIRDMSNLVSDPPLSQAAPTSVLEALATAMTCSDNISSFTVTTTESSYFGPAGRQQWGTKSASLDEPQYPSVDQLPHFSADEHLRLLRVRAGLDRPLPAAIIDGQVPASTSPQATMRASASMLPFPGDSQRPPPSSASTSSTTTHWFDGIFAHPPTTQTAFPSKPRPVTASTPSLPSLFGGLKSGLTAIKVPPQSVLIPTAKFAPPKVPTLTNLFSSAAAKAQTVATGAIKQANAAAGAALEVASQLAASSDATAMTPQQPPHDAPTAPVRSSVETARHTHVADRLDTLETVLKDEGGQELNVPQKQDISIKDTPVTIEAPVQPQAPERRWLHEQMMDMTTTDDDYDDDIYERNDMFEQYDNDTAVQPDSPNAAVHANGTGRRLPVAPWEQPNIPHSGEAEQERNYDLQMDAETTDQGKYMCGYRKGCL